MIITSSEFDCGIAKMIRANISSPFSQKNIQECRCGTESCRGVLGPKPKKPIEDKSFTSALIAGTKRKIQDIFGIGRAGPDSNAGSLKKRKVDLGDATTTKARNAYVQSKAARERAEKDAGEHSRQIASREERAMARSIPDLASKRARSAQLRTTKPTSISFARHTTVSFQRKISKTNTLEPIKNKRSPSTTIERHAPKFSSKRKLGVSSRPSTPIQDSDAESSRSEDDTWPNITPASLRSASRNAKQLSLTSQQRSRISSATTAKSRIAHTTGL